MTVNDQNEKNYLPFPVIKSAASGDPMAIKIVIKHFDGYMTECSKRKYKLFGGGSIYLPDPEIKDELIIRLIEASMSFKL